MSSSLTQLALSGIQASQIGLNTTGQNIANAQTPGFSRQTVVQAASTPLFTGSGYLGTGASVEGIRRTYSSLLSAQVRSAASQASRASTYADGIAQINNVIGNADRSASVAITNFFAAVQQVTASPSDAAARQSMFASAQTLAQRFRDLDLSLTEQESQINERIGVALDDINGTVRQIAAINTRIAGEVADGRQPNDLLDQRDVLLSTLNKSLWTQTAENGDGTVSVYLANGQALVSGGVVQTLALGQNAADPGKPVIGFKTGNSALPLAGALDLGGELGGLVALRDEALVNARNGLGRIARVLAETINNQQALGQDVRDRAGTDFFAIDDPQVSASTGNRGDGVAAVTVSDVSALAASDYSLRITAEGYQVIRLADGQQQTFGALPAEVDGLRLTMAGNASVGDSFRISATAGASGSFRVVLPDATRIATAYPVMVTADRSNSGNAAADITVLSGDASLRDSVSIVFDANGQATVTSGGATETLALGDGNTLNYHGWQLSFSATPAAGDRFSVSAASGNTGDNHNVLALAGLADSDLVNGASYANAYAQLVADFGIRGREAEALRSATESVATAAVNSRDAVSGVSLEEEAMNMLRYQQAYQAAGKLLSVANTLFDTILQVSR